MTAAFVAIIGLCLGSFYSVCAGRYGTAQTIFSPARSHCPQCHHQLSVYENIPLVSYLLQRGRCRHCNVSIPPLYPLLEVVSMFWALMAAQSASTFFEWVVLMLIGGICIIASAIDLRTFLLPNVLTYSGAVIVLGASFSGLLSISFADSLAGAIVGPSILWAVAALFKLARNMEGLGIGDVKFMVMLGGLVGWQGLSWLILVASASALIFALFYLKGKDNMTRTPIPFGPFLALGACVTYVYLPKLQVLL